jgi:hypothetical protein
VLATWAICSEKKLMRGGWTLPLSWLCVVNRKQEEEAVGQNQRSRRSAEPMCEAVECVEEKRTITSCYHI